MGCDALSCPYSFPSLGFSMCMQRHHQVEGSVSLAQDFLAITCCSTCSADGCNKMTFVSAECLPRCPRGEGEVNTEAGRRPAPLRPSGWHSQGRRRGRGSPGTPIHIVHPRNWPSFALRSLGLNLTERDLIGCWHLMIRAVSPACITYLPPTDYKHPHLGPCG